MNNLTRNDVDEMIDTKLNSFSNMTVPTHVHNGIDSPFINYTNYLGIGIQYYDANNPDTVLAVMGDTQFDGSISISDTLNILEGVNKSMGVVTLVGGTATVLTSLVTADSRIFLTVQGGILTNVGFQYVSTRTPGTSFTITSSDTLDVSDVAWIIIEPQ